MSLFFTGCQEEDNSKETGGEVSEREELKKVTLNEVAHSIFTRPSMWRLRKGTLWKRGSNWKWSLALALIRSWLLCCPGNRILDLWGLSLPSMPISKGQTTR